MRGANDTPEEARNKEIVLAMWQGVIVDFSPDAVLRYLAPDYIQHNPAVPPGRQFLYDAVKELSERKKTDPGLAHTTKRLIHAFADGDLVVLTWTLDVPEPDDPSKTYVASAFDMFRLKDGIIVEHWDDVRKGE